MPFIAKFEREKERRREIEIAKITKKINDAIKEARQLGLRIVLTFPNQYETEIETTYSIQVTR